MKISTIVIEDEIEIKNWILEKLKHFPECDVVGSASSINEAYLLIASEKPTAAFMDIQIIGGNIFQLIEKLKNNGIPVPLIVITSGYPEFVMDAINDHRKYIVQYLLKPLVDNWESKFRKSIDAIIAAISSSHKNTETKDITTHAFINSKGHMIKIAFKDILYVEAAGSGESYLVSNTETKKIDITLNKLMEFLPSDLFFRVSKTNIINLYNIESISREDHTLEILMQNGKSKSIGIGETFYGELMKKLPLLKDFIK
jgi:DNA-binding LytR/AlgR family response regulator